MRFDSDTLGPYLRRERERRGITLDAIATRTKIARSLLTRLERGDVSGWPAGIFRRAFFREYVAAIGLDADDLLPEFLRVFPDPSADAIESAAATRTGEELRLTLAADVASGRCRAARLRAALVDIATVGALAMLLSAVVGHAALVMALVAVGYHAVATAAGTRTLGAWLLSPGPVIAPPLTAAEASENYERSSRPSRAMIRMRTNAATIGSDAHQTHGSFAHQAPVIR